MKNNLLHANNKNISDVLGNGKKYLIPLYQRDYSWKEENWEDLWDDILDVENSVSPHYMGSIVLQVLGDDKFTIIDGQQRLVTVSIIILACINKINKIIESGVNTTENKERTFLLKNQYIGSKDSSSLNYASKLTLNENNQNFYKLNLLKLKEPINYRKLKDSDKLLWDAFDFFVSKVNDKFDGKTGLDIANFLNKVVAKKLFFIEIVVDDEFSAYTVFETMNSRGVELTPTDLLKNYLFSLVAKSNIDLEDTKDQWKKIVEVIRLNNFPTFLRHYIQSYEKTVKKNKLFKRIKTQIKTDNDVFNLLDGLESSSYLYQALNDPNDEFWKDYEEYKASGIVRTLKLFKVSQYKSLVLAAFKKFDSKSFVQTLRICSVISFRYNVVGRYNPNELEVAYNKTAIKVSNGEITNIHELFKTLKSVYIEDEVFKNDFSTKGITTKSYKKLVSYILTELENGLNRTHLDFEVNNATIEHILPESLTNDWEEDFDEDTHSNYLNRLGNLTLLESSLNRDVGNGSYTSKRAVLKSSSFKLSNEIDSNEWNPTAIKLRQEKMAKLATSIWMINY